MSGPGDRLGTRFAEHLARLEPMGPGQSLVVAVSGGLDSVVLLHLLRFAVPHGPGLHVAHLDHGMRAGSEGDARWVTGLARAWGLPLSVERAASAPASEAEARTVRYAFLDRVRREAGASWTATAHHADDQAETVLFRILRGTGLRGLTGIHARRDDGVLRPLLPFWREEIEAYAAARGITYRTDPSNQDPRWARNRIRHELLPTIERELGASARKSLVRLSALARSNEESWESLVPEFMDRLDARELDGCISVARQELLSYDPTVRARVLRALARRLGGRLDAAATEAALSFAERGSSGRRLALPGGLGFARSFDRLELGRFAGTAPDQELEIPASAPGAGRFAAGGRLYTARWGPEPDGSGTWNTRFLGMGLGFPLRFRSWRPGDRMHVEVGTKKVSKVFAEARVPVDERARSAVLADSGGRILWIPGVARASLSGAGDGDLHFAVGIADAHTS